MTYGLMAANILIFVLVSLPLSLQPADPNDPATVEYVRVLSNVFPGSPSPAEIVQSLSSHDVFVFDYGYRPSDPSATDIVTSMFLHAGFAHLFGNMLFLWIYGDNVEHRLGPLKFLFWYVLSGIAATLFHGVFAGGSPIPLVGASGAISGVLGFYFLWFPHNQVRILFFWIVILRVFMLPARWVLGFYIIVTNILPFLVTQGQGSGVAYGAHIGGFFAGLTAAFFYDRRELTSQPKEYRGLAPEPRSDALRARLRDAILGQRFEKAAELYFEVPPAQSHGLLDPDASVALGSWLAQNGHSRAALTVFQRHLRDYPLGPGLAEAHAYAGLVQLHAFREPTAAYQHFVEALGEDPPRALEKTIRDALAEIEAMQKFPVRRVH